MYANGIDTFNAPGHVADKVTDNALNTMESNGIKILKRVRKLNKEGDGIYE